MDPYELSDKNLAAIIGSRLKALRLRKNISQQELAQSVLLSLNSIKALEQGKGKISSLIAVLRALGALAELDQFIPDISVSPIQLAKMQGKKRQRATRFITKDKPHDSET